MAWKPMETAPRDGSAIDIKVQLISGNEKVYKNCKWHESRVVTVECCGICREDYEILTREGWYSGAVRLPLICTLIGWIPQGADPYRCMSCQSDVCQCSKLIADRKD